MNKRAGCIVSGSAPPWRPEAFVRQFIPPVPRRLHQKKTLVAMAQRHCPSPALAIVGLVSLARVTPASTVVARRLEEFSRLERQCVSAQDVNNSK